MVRDCSLIQFVDYIYFFFMYWGGEVFPSFVVALEVNDSFL